MSYRIGIDVGGTNTDAVILDENYRVMNSVKSPTTKDVSTGIFDALHKVIEQSDISASEINYAMLGTTHATNAIVERKRLNSIAVIRIGAPASLSVKPFIDFPDDLSVLLTNHVYLIEGGHEVDGREINSLDEEKLRQIAQDIRGKVSAVAVTSIFSPVSQQHEERAAEILKEELGEEMSISLSFKIGSVGLLERENATILNASLTDVARTTVNGFVRALKKESIQAKVYLGQNDGTLMSVDYAMKYPILTIACGPTNSLRGASFLEEYSDCIVVDVGGTTTDIGVLADRFPRESSLAVEIGGVRTNFRMPDLISVGLGGGTIIRIAEDSETFTIGPDSVGYQLPEKALIYGGDTLTATDIVVALKKAALGDPEKVAHLNQTLLQKIYDKMVEKVEEAIDKIKTEANDMPVILVGGGNILLPDKLKGASVVKRPEHAGVANAIGASIAQVSGQVEKIFMLDRLGREETIEQAKALAKKNAIEAGANPDDLSIVDIEDVPLSYLPDNATRIKVKAAGSLKA